jgi:mRNA-degrading endonuclease RelE of RelBE toxin-antitoxin system
VAARKTRAGGGAGRGGGRAAPALPEPSGDAPLAELSRDHLSVFLYLALLPEETRHIARSLGLRIPGFRTDSLSDVELCDMLADEIRAGAEDARGLVLEKLRAAFGRPPLPATGLDAAGADDLLAVGKSEHGMALALWRVLADPSPSVRERAREPLGHLFDRYYGPPPEGEPPAEGPGEASPGPAAEGGGRAADLERKLERARAQAEESRQKAEAQREKIQAQLREARAREAAAAGEAARAREASREAQRARERAESALAAAQATDLAQELQRARSAARDLEGRVGSLEARLARAGERDADLSRQLEEARARAEAPAEPAAATVEAEEPEEAPAAWLMPVFTREFYDSLEGWDRRIQRAAFKQAHLLAQDVRHPSLRALPLEGLPGYYRVRVATDVRLLYRRPEKQNAVEILSLIDREDLDRYIKQAKTR